MASRKHKQQPKKARSSAKPASAAALPVAQRPIDAKPRPAVDELPEDSALFNRTAFDLLDQEMRGQCDAVKQALELAESGLFQAATAALQSIPRQSPYADWRLFIRGLCDFYAQDHASAVDAWSRLNAQRRPARIACALLDAVARPRPESLNDVTVWAESVKIASQTLDRTHILAEAQKIARIKPANDFEKFNRQQACLLRNFADRFRATDKVFAQPFMRACVAQSSRQPDDEVFRHVKNLVEGPDYDRAWALAGLLRTMGVDNDLATDLKMLQEYCQRDLSASKRFDKEAQAALKSMLLTHLSGLADEENDFEEMDSEELYDLRLCILNDAIETYPKNRAAHLARLKLCDELIDGSDFDDLSDKEQDNWCKKCLAYTEQTVAVWPNDLQFVRALTGNYLLCGQYDRALAQARHAAELGDDPYKNNFLQFDITLRQAVAMSRTKANFYFADGALSKALELWPGWLDRASCAFLKAALELRMGNKQAFDNLQAHSASEAKVPPLTSALMKYWACQCFHVAANEIKRIRDDLDKQIGAVGKLSTPDLLWAGSFLFDAARIGLPGTGMDRRFKSIGKEICDRSHKIDFAAQHGEACYAWLARHEFFGQEHQLDHKATTARMASAFLDYIGMNNIPISEYRLRELLDILEAGLPAEQDPWHQNDMSQTAELAADLLSSGFNASDFMDFKKMVETMAKNMNVDLSKLKDMPPQLLESLARLMGFAQDDEDEEDDEDDEDDFEDDDFEEDDFEEDNVYEDRHRSDWAFDHPAVEIMDLGRNAYSAMPPNIGKFDGPEINLPSAPKTASERQAFNKQRHKELDRAKKRK